MQSMRWLLECYKFNALLILLTYISHDRFSMVFGITVNPLESLAPSAYGSDEYADTGDGSNEFDTEVHDLNHIDISQFANGYSKFVDSQETVSISSMNNNDDVQAWTRTRSCNNSKFEPLKCCSVRLALITLKPIIIRVLQTL